MDRHDRQHEDVSHGAHQAAVPPASGGTIRVPTSLLEALWDSSTKTRVYWDACERSGANVEAAAADLEAALGRAEWHCGVFNAAGGIAGANREQEGEEKAPAGGDLLLALKRLVERFNIEYPAHRPVPHEVTIALDAIAWASGSANLHSDDAAIDRFAAAMKAKLAASRAKGRSGWDDPEQCSTERLAELLIGHLPKGNAGTFEDVRTSA